jgi:hypothetical protein
MAVWRLENQSCGWHGSPNVLVGFAGVAADKDLRVLLSIGRSISLSEPPKMLLVRLLWKKTTMSQVMIAEHLGMKHAADLSSVIHSVDLSRLEKKAPGKLKRFVSEKMKKMNPAPQFPRESLTNE